MNKSKKINISYIDPASLSPAGYNPRKWDEAAISKLTDSIKRFGLVDPLIVNSAPERKNIIIGGHLRNEVIKRLSIDKVPVIFVNLPDIKKEKELNLRLNRNQGEWDYDLLKSFNIDFLTDIGFHDGDLEAIWDEALSVEDDKFNTYQELKKIKKPKTQSGDIFRLGENILGCGNSTDRSFINKLVGSSKIDMLYLDPPYNLNLDYDKGIGGKGSYGGTYKDNKTKKEYEKFLKDSLSNALHHAKKDCHIFCYCDESFIGLLQDLYRKLGIKSRRVCLWIKNNQNLTPQVAFNKVYEPCVYGTVGSPYLSGSIKNISEVLNKEIGNGNEMLEDIYDMFNIWLVKRLATQSYSHPTEKPPSLHEKPLRRCTKVGDMVLDLFGGSGSTLIACQQLKRKCYMSEIEPIFCDLIIRRFENLTGIKAELIN